MMDEALKTHKEDKFGWVQMIQEAVSAGQVWLARRARRQAARTIREAQARPRRFLGLR